MIIRAKRKSGYTVMSNKGLTDERMSWKARGLLAYLLSKPDDWSISERQLADAGPDGRDAVRSALKELEGYSYVKREKTRDEKGQIVWVSWIADEPWSDYPTTGEPTTGEPTTGEPTTGEPTTGEPTTENPTIVSTIVTNPVVPSTDPTSTEHQTVADATAATPPSLSEQFQKFHHELKNSPNRAEVLLRAYIACHSEQDAPTHGRLGTFAGRIGSWGMALDAIWNCTSRPPNGDILSYLEKAKQTRGKADPDDAERRASYRVEGNEPTTGQPPPDAATIRTPQPVNPLPGDPWSVALQELRLAFKGYPWLDSLEGSLLEEADSVADGNGKTKPLYRVIVTATQDTSWLTTQAGIEIRKKLGSILGKPVLVEIVAAQPEPEPSP